jgi:hypothetical protein
MYAIKFKSGASVTNCSFKEFSERTGKGSASRSKIFGNIENELKIYQIPTVP